MDSPALQQPLLFISDVHLGGFSNTQNERIESELIQLINYCQRNDIRLAVLGDLFDYWMEYPEFVPDLGKKLLDRFEDFNTKLGPTLYITGNHDNWTRDHLKKRGFYLIHEQYLFSTNNKKVLALHGDGLSDPAYNLRRPLMHRILRSRKFVTLFQKVFPPQMGNSVMKYFSRLTRKMEWDARKKEQLNNWARQQLKNSDVEIILTGHDHIPRRKHFTFGTYINLGTFYKHKTMCYYNNDGFSLVCWKPELQTLNQFETSIN